ncbi:hypothetical protein JZ751_007325 [Albula glossodonta]|uniref:Uncharacterized protein n=1 Tax=Albula glossodonta TaxID=121402 RepID=A0A8T2N413_9TELE|nr:hypothetical protein JZ751_007325 [Albula glossodonta]
MSLSSRGVRRGLLAVRHRPMSLFITDAACVCAVRRLSAAHRRPQVCGEIAKAAALRWGRTLRPALPALSEENDGFVSDGRAIREHQGERVGTEMSPAAHRVMLSGCLAHLSLAWTAVASSAGYIPLARGRGREGETQRDGEQREGETQRDGEQREGETQRDGEQREGETQRDGEQREGRNTERWGAERGEGETERDGEQREGETQRDGEQREGRNTERWGAERGEGETQRDGEQREGREKHREMGSREGETQRDGE